MKLKNRKKMKNCPFCGAGWMLVQTRVDFRKGIFEDAWYVNCNTGCNARTTNWHTEQQAIDAWNNRFESGSIISLKDNK